MRYRIYSDTSPTMRVEIEARAGGLKAKEPGCGCFPTAMSRSNAMRGELWVGVTPNELRPRIRAPMKGALRPRKPREERLIPSNINRYET
ncbi:MAG TPA: hypothetical protein VNL13_05150 [Sulfolobales archaeon]|nr:hypothetical protein [Sulfolobales archaeon]